MAPRLIPPWMVNIAPCSPEQLAEFEKRAVRRAIEMEKLGHTLFMLWARKWKD